MCRLEGLEPFILKDSEILILGSFPSVISLQESFYFMNAKNRLWPILHTIYKESTDTKESKELFCKKYKIAFFDVIKSCIRDGSLDSNIKDYVANDIVSLCNTYTSIKKIVTLGTLSKKLFLKYNDVKKLDKIEVYHLPSTSSLNTRYSQDDLLELFTSVLKGF